MLRRFIGSAEDQVRYTTLDFSAQELRLNLQSAPWKEMQAFFLDIGCVHNQDAGVRCRTVGMVSHY